MVFPVAQYCFTFTAVCEYEISSMAKLMEIWELVV